MKQHRKINDLLSSLDDLTPAKLPDGFEERLYQKLAFLPKSRWVRWTKLGIAAMITLALANSVTLVFMNEFKAYQTLNLELLSDDLAMESNDLLKLTEE